MIRDAARALLPIVVALGLVAACTPAALGDGDPASDVLLGQNVYYPFSPAVSAPLQHALDAETAAAAKAGFPIKVALIASPPDLGVIPDLFGKPQRYAAFLDQEISYQRKQPLLVVMASGYGAVGLPPAAQRALSGIKPPGGKGSDDLARAASTAVARLSTAAGHPLKGTSGGSSGSSGTTVLLVVLIAVAAVIALALAIVTVRRSREAPSSP